MPALCTTARSTTAHRAISRLVLSAALFAVPSLVAPARAAAQEADAAPTGPLATLQQAVSETKPLFNIRLRYETTEFGDVLDRAHALTYRIRAGLQTGEAYGTSFLIDFDHIEPIVNDYNSTINGRTSYAVVADPETTELNRIQLVNKSLPDTTVTLGRQRINFDDHRFVGNVGWRQNEQTFDAVRVENSSLGPLTANFAYLTQVNRIFGEDSAAGVFDGDSYLVNLGLKTPLGKATAFAYLIDIDQGGGGASSQTFGFRFAGAQPVGETKISYAASYANQGDYGSSNIDYSADFYSVDLGASLKGFNAGIGYEVLGGDDARGFQTPLATLHKFNGWADIFLATPANGLEDLYGSLGYAAGDLGPFKAVTTKVIYHDFGSDIGSTSYGSEIDAIVTTKVKKLALLLKYADYSADEFSADKQVLWFQIDYGF